MDSVTEDDPTLPLDFEKSTNLARFKEAIASGEFGEEMLNSSGEFPEGTLQDFPGISDNAKEGPVSSQMKTLRDYELQMSDLKKENFGLKLRIYFLEERLSHDDTPEDIFKANIELKVTVEELKKELVEKQELLIKASNAVEMIANHSDSQVKLIKQKQEEYLSDIRENYENNMKEMEKELTSTKRDLDDVAERLAEALNMNQQLNEKLLESTAGFNDGQLQLQEQTKETLNIKDKMIDDLNDALEAQRRANKELEEKTQTLEEEKERAQNDLRKLVEGEKKLKGMAEELHKRNQSFEDLKEKARKLEKLNRELKNQLHEVERQQHLSSRNSVENSPEVKLKNKTKIEDLEKNLAAARESAHTAKMKWYQTFEEHSEVVRARDASIAALQSNISAKDMELERLIQSLSSKDIELQRFKNDKLVLEQKLDELLKQKDKEVTGLTKKLKDMVNQYTKRIEDLEKKYRKDIGESQEQVQLKDRIIEKLASGNNEKDKIIEDIVEALKDVSADNSTLEDTQDIRDNLLKKLQNQLKQKERAVQSAMDEKFKFFEEKDVELQQLRQAVRERDRLIEKINATVMGTEHQIQLFEKACNEKDDMIEKLKTSNEEQNKAHKDALDAVTASNRNNEAMFQKLKINLEAKEKELKGLKEFVKDITRSTSQNPTEEGIKFQDLTEDLKEKEQFIENLLQERSRMTSVTEANSQRLMTALQEKDKLLKDASDSLIRIQADKNSTIQHLQEQLNNKELEMQSLENNKGWMSQEQELLMNKLRSGLKDKDTTIEELVESNKEKDQLLMRLQDSLRTPKKQSEMAALKQTIKELESALRTKNDALKRFEAEYEANGRKNSQAELENIDNRMKIENLEHELKAKETVIQQSLQTIENLRNKLKTMPIIEDLKQKFAEQNQALSAAQKDKEQAQMELALLKKSKLEYDCELKAKHDDIDVLTHAAQIKDNMIKEMQDTNKKQVQDMQENVGYYQRKAYDLETSNDALRQQLAECSQLNTSLQRQLEMAQTKANAQSPYRKDVEELNQLREEVTLLRQQTNQLSTKQRETTQGGPANDDMSESVPHLQKVLQEQVAETTKLNDILMKERQMYINVVQHLREPSSDPNRSNSPVTRELQILKALRTQLEDGIRQNNILRNQLQDQITSNHLKGASPVPPPPSPYDAVYQREIKELTSRLEESERWNASLQARLNDSAGLDVVDSKLSSAAASKESIQRLEEQVDNLTKSLQQTTYLKERISKELEDFKSSNYQASLDKDAVINSQSLQISNLQNQLQTTKRTFLELENRLKDANEKLEYYARNVNGDYEDLLLEREHEVESLRTALKEIQLREESASQKQGSDMAAQTTPMIPRGYVSSEKLKEVEEKLHGEINESVQRNNYYKKLLDLKVEELQKMKQSGLKTNTSDNDQDMTAIQKLRQEYEKGLITNEELKLQLESEIESVSNRERSLQADVLTISDLRQKLDKSLRCNDSLQGILRENLKPGSGVDRVKRELEVANRKNEALALQIENLNQSIRQFNDMGDEAKKLRCDVQEAHKLNETLSQQLKDMKSATSELPLVQRELKQSKVMNEQLGKQLADLLNHMAKLKAHSQKLKSEVEQKSKIIESLELRLSSKQDVHSRGVSPVFTMETKAPVGMTPPHRDHVYTQTSPGYGLSSPPSVTRLSSPPSPSKREPSPTSVIEKMHGLNKTLMSENQFLRSKLQQNERFTSTLKDELEFYNRMRRESLPEHTSPNRMSGNAGQSMDEILAMYMTEMRELRMRLEESIHTNDKLRAQLEKRMAEGELGGDGDMSSSERLLPYIHENERLRTELLAKDNASEQLKRELENIKRTREMEKAQLDILRQQGEENHQVIINLQNELRVYEQLYKLSSSRAAEQHYQGTSYVREGPRSPDGSADNSAIMKLLAEIKSLRLQLEKSISTNNALRLKLEEQLSRPIRESPHASRVSPSDVARRLDFDKNTQTIRPGLSAGLLAAHIDREYFIELESKIQCIHNETAKLITKMQTDSQPLFLVNSIRNLHTWSHDCKGLLERFVIDNKVVSCDDGSVVNENMTLRLQISKLKKKLLYQEDAIKKASEQLEESTKKKEGMQTHLIDRLLESQAVLQRTRGSLEDYAKTRTDR